jgi:hypothetical protein
MSWNHVKRLHTVIFRSTNQQSATGAGLIYEAPTLSQPGQAPNSLPQRMTGLALRRFELLYSGGGTSNVGIGFRLHNNFWRVGNYDGTTFVEDTADAQNLTANDFTIGANGTTGNTTFFTILSTIPFDWFSINVGTAEVDAGGATVPDHSLRYSNAAGTGWTNFTAGFLNNFELTNTVIGTGAREFIWAAPTDWGRTAAALTGLPVGYYAMQITSQQLEAGDTAALGNAMEVGTMLVAEALAANGIYAKDWTTMGLAEGDAVVAYFGTADANNRVEVEVTTA